MSRASLELVMSDLLALEEVDEPDMPVDVYLQEGLDLLTWIRNNADMSKELWEVGPAPEIVGEVELLIGATRQAQADWTASRSTRKPEEQAEIEEKGRSARSAAVAACRYSLRRDRAAQGALDNVRQGNSLPDLIQDLEDLATLVENHAAAFAKNQRFVPAIEVPALRSLANEIRVGLAEYRESEARRTLIDIRNRAWTKLDERLEEIRDAGQYVFAGQRAAREFTSAYERRQRAAQRRKKKQKEQKQKEQQQQQ